VVGPHLMVTAMVEIIDESDEVSKRLVLYINGSRTGTATKKKLSGVDINWLVYGPQNLDKAEHVLNGMMELFFHAKQL